MLKTPRSFFLGVGLLVFWVFYFLSGRPSLRLATAPATVASLFGKPRSESPLSPHVHTYFDQVFAVDTPPKFDFPAIKAACARAEWKEDNVYLQCGGMAAGMTSILSQVKVCVKMAIDAGVNIVLPSMPLRDSDDLLNFNFLNSSAYMTYEEWFDMEHLTSSMARVCPRMRIRHPKLLNTVDLPVSHDWSIDIGTAPGYQWLAGYFWVGRPFKVWFDEQLAALRADTGKGKPPQQSRATRGEGATVIGIASQFLLYRITDDATGRDLALWNDISHLIRFKREPRAVTAKILSLIHGPFIGFHFRTENDNIWSDFDTQLRRGLETLDTIWSRAGTPHEKRPLVYLACGDESQILRFSETAKARGWNVTSKYALVKDEPDILAQLNQLPFDFQGAIDMGIMLKSHFFLGITGSAFSSTVANMRDVTGRYRGSSILFPDDENARTHLFNDGDATGYPCCL